MIGSATLAAAKAGCAGPTEGFVAELVGGDNAGAGGDGCGRHDVGSGHVL